MLPSLIILMLKMNSKILNINIFYKRIAFLLGFLFYASGMIAQEVTVTAKLDSTRIIIGDHLKMHISVTAPNQSNITIQPYEQWQLANCEIVEVKPLISNVKGEKTIYEQEAVLISFDTGIAAVAPIFVLVDTIPVAKTELLQFHVDSLPVFVDTTLAFKDIKAPLDGEDIELLPDEKAKSNWKKVLLITVLILLVLGAAAYVYWKYVRTYLRNKKVAEVKHKLKENAGLVALNSLKSLKAKKLWQKGQVKDYYSELSEIIRTYIDSQWDVNAMEMVTAEIMEAIDNLDVDDEQMKELNILLERADLVKYAKEQPIVEENEVSYKKACDFVKVTDRAERAKEAEKQEQRKRK